MMDIESWITIANLVTFIALIFQVGAFVSPMWIWLQNSSTYVGVGLWYIVGCVGTTCTGGYNETVYSLGSMVALRVLQSVGTAGILALVVFLYVYKAGYSGKWGSMGTINLASFILCLLTVLVLLASAAVYLAFFWPVFLLVNTYDPSSFPWSWLMSVIAAIILMIVCFLIRNRCRPKVFRGEALPMSGDSKFELHPQVHNGNVSRYYNQTPYAEDRYYVDQGRTPRYDDYDDRMRNGGPSTERTSYINRVYQSDAEPQPANVYYTKPTARDFRENRDRELGHTIYTGGNGFSYLKGEVSRQSDRDEVRYGRPVALMPSDFTAQTRNYDDYYDQMRSSARVVSTSTSRGVYQPSSSNVYIYRPHQF